MVRLTRLMPSLAVVANGIVMYCQANGLRMHGNDDIIPHSCYDVLIILSYNQSWQSDFDTSLCKHKANKSANTIDKSIQLKTLYQTIDVDLVD